MLWGQFLGGFRVGVGAATIRQFATRKSRSLVAYLMLNPGKSFSRQVLADTLWGEASTGDVMKALRQELWVVRRTFREATIDPENHFSLEGEDIGVKGEPTLDTTAFEAATEILIKVPDRALDEATASTLEEAVALFDGELLPGLYDDWCLFPREILRDKYIIVVERLMEWHADRQNWGNALLFGKRLLDIDPLLEHIHRDMMRYHYARGDRPAALRQFEQCRQRLRRELSIEPMAETATLHEAIRRESEAELNQRALQQRNKADRRRVLSKARPPTPTSQSALDAIRNDLDTVGRRIEALMRAEKNS